MSGDWAVTDVKVSVAMIPRKTSALLIISITRNIWASKQDPQHKRTSRTVSRIVFLFGLALTCNVARAPVFIARAVQMAKAVHWATCRSSLQYPIP